jgi:hypothetical protein
MAQLARVAPNPPKEEGGGDELNSAYIMQRINAATQYPPRFAKHKPLKNKEL